MKMAKFGNALINSINKVEALVKRFKVEFVKVQEIQEQKSIGWIGTFQICPDGEYKEIPYFINNTTILLHLGIPSILPGIGAFKTDQGATIIVMNKAFKTEPEWVQEAFMAHEYGHIVNKDFQTLLNLGLDDPQKYTKARKVGNKEILRMEYEADKYSFYAGFRIKAALIHLSTKYPSFNTKEVRDRVEKLRQL